MWLANVGAAGNIYIYVYVYVYAYAYVYVYVYVYVYTHEYVYVYVYAYVYVCISATVPSRHHGAAGWHGDHVNRKNKSIFD